MDRTTERALKRAVRDEAAVRLRGDAVGPDAVEALIRRLVEEIASESGISLPPYEFEGLASAMIDDFLRYGPLQRLLEDESVTEIMVNGGGIDLDDPALPFRAPIVYVERAGRIEYRPDVEFDDAEHVRRIINKIAEQSGKRCDDAHAMGCAMLPGGRARATYVVPPIAPDGPALNVRTFSSSMLGMEDLVRMGMLTDGMSQFLRAAVQARCPLVISGGTGSGKTTLLGALSGFIPPDERVITIEDTPELRLQTPHVERMQTREANTEGEGSVSMRELVALSLRRRPDRIIVGECRGAEAYDMLQAMQTDHPGSMTTVHANDPFAYDGGLRRRRPQPRRHRPADCRVVAGRPRRARRTHARRGPPSDQHRGDRSASRREPRHPACRAVRFRRRGRRCVRRRRGRVARVRRAAPAHQGAHARIGRMVRPRLVFRSMRRAEA